MEVMHKIQDEVKERNEEIKEKGDTIYIVGIY